MKELYIDAIVENLDAVLSFVEESLEESDCPMKLMTQINIAIEEVFVNIAHYAYSQDVGGVNIRVIVDDDIRIEFEDHGIAYNPLEREDPNIALDAEARAIGGLGIFMVKKMMDEVTYARDGHKNILMIRKTI